MKPNFFIIGAPKSGTTALASYLSEHSDAFVSVPKEPHFYADDLPDYNIVGNHEKYLKIFESGSDSQRVGEASVYYLYSVNAINNIKREIPEAKIIVMLRNPLEMLYSLHSQLISSANEDVLSFSKAWGLSDERQEGRNIPQNCKSEKVLDYKNIAKYGLQMKRIYECFDRQDVLVILYDDFSANAKKEYDRTLKFLNLENDAREIFLRINANSKPRSTLVNRFLKKQSGVILGLNKLIKLLNGGKSLGLVAFFNGVNSKVVQREKLDNAMKKLIWEEYKDDIQMLSVLLNRDLIKLWRVQ